VGEGEPGAAPPLGPPPELNIRVNSPGCPPPPESPGVEGRLGGGVLPAGGLKRLAKSVDAGGAEGAIGSGAAGGGALPDGELNIRVKSPDEAGGAAGG